MQSFAYEKQCLCFENGWGVRTCHNPNWSDLVINIKWLNEGNILDDVRCNDRKKSDRLIWDLILILSHNRAVVLRREYWKVHVNKNVCVFFLTSYGLLVWLVLCCAVAYTECNWRVDWKMFGLFSFIEYWNNCAHVIYYVLHTLP